MAFATLLACAPAISPCLSAATCPAREECLAHRCVPLGADPVPAGSQRRLVEASSVAVVGPTLSGALPPTVTFGGPPAHDEQLLVSFPDTWSSLDVSAAFLLLEPAAEADPTATDVPVHVALAGGRWSPGAARQAPPEHSPSTRGLARTRPPSVLRVDVTSLVRALGEHPGLDHGFLLRGAKGARTGATYLTGSAGGTPRLDVYGRARSRR